jgi:prophage regulatory protein
VKEGLVAKLPKWTPGQWDAWRRGVESGKLIARLDTRPIPPGQGDRLLRREEVEKRVGLHRSSIWRLERAGDFPKRVRLTGRTVAWRASEVDAWIVRRNRASS